MRGIAPGDQVVVDTLLLRQFEKAAEDGPSAESHILGFALYVVLVHELVHWGAHRLGGLEYSEKGNSWEIDMFGRDIQFHLDPRTRRYWIE